MEAEIASVIVSFYASCLRRFRCGIIFLNRVVKIMERL